MEHDLILQNMFGLFAYAKAGVTGASKFIANETYHTACGVAVYIGSIPEEECNLVTGKVYPYDENELPMKHIADINSILPEVLLDSDTLGVPDIQDNANSYRFLPTQKTALGEPGIMVLYDRIEYFEYLGTIPYADNIHIRSLDTNIYSIPHEVIDCLDANEAKMSDFKAVFMISRLTTGSLVLMLTGETSLFYTVTAKANGNKREILIYNPVDEHFYCADGWIEKSKKYNKIIKKPKKGFIMPKLANPVKGALLGLPKINLAVEADASDAEINKAAVAKVTALGTTEDKEPEAPEEAPIALEDVVETVEEVVEAVVEEVSAPDNTEALDLEVSTEAESIKEPATPKKPTRTKKPTTTVGFDFTKIMEYLGGTVEVNTTDDFDKAVAEIRGLRDLQIVIARRSANLAIEIHKTSGAAVSQVAALRELLK